MNRWQRYATKKGILREWRDKILPAVKAQYEDDGVPDYPARVQAWNDWIDELIREQRIPPSAGNWTHPATNQKRKPR